MISRKALIHHLDSIEHQAGIFARTASEPAHESAQFSKGVIIKNFDLLNGVSLSAAAQPFDGNIDGPIYRQPAGDQKYCKHCEQFFLLDNSEVIEWHNNAACRNRIEVSLDWHTIDDYPGKRQQFRDLQRGREIPPKALEGYKVREVFGDSGGRLIVVYEK